MRFSIRDLLWVILVIGMGLGWSVHSWRLNDENRRLRERNSAVEAEILIHTVEQLTDPRSAAAPAPYPVGIRSAPDQSRP